MRIAAVLEERILRAVETSRDPGSLREDLDLFLPICTMAVSKSVPTACITRQGDRCRIEFGKDFLEKELKDDQDLLFVLLHEAFHHVLGHLTASAAPMGPRMRDAANVAADILVNRAVLRRFFPGGVRLLERMYPPADLVGALLRPPDGDLRLESSRFEQALRAAGVPGGVIEEAWDVRVAGWYQEVPFAMLLTQVVDLLRRAGVPVGVVFLGNHDVEGDPVPGLPWEDEDGGCGAGFSDELDEDELDEPVEPAPSPELAMAVRRALVSDPWHRSRRVTNTPVTSPVFSPGRSDWPFLTLGYWPTLFHGPRRDTAVDDQRAHVYVDVSGSFDAYVGRVYGLLLALAEDVGSPVHLFSNVVEDVTLDELARGLRRTTGGTDFNCVARHVLEHRYRQVVLVTDGFGDLDGGLAEALQAAGVSVYLLLLGSDAGTAAIWSPLPALAREVWGMG